VNLHPPIRLTAGFVSALLITAMAAGIRLLALHELGNSVPYITFYPAIIITALLCGLLPGLLATILSALMASYWWIEPSESLKIAASADRLSLFVFLLNSLFICAVTEMMFRARRRAALLETETAAELKQPGSEQTILKQQIILERMSQLAKIGGWYFDTATMQGERTPQAALIHESDEKNRVDVLREITRYQEESRQRIELAIKEAIELGKPYELELELLTASGHRKWIRTHGYPVVRDGKVVGIEGADQDITESKLNLNALKESEARYAALFENMREGLALCRMHYDETGKEVDFEYLKVNGSFYTQTGLADVTGKTSSQIIPGTLQTNPELLEIYTRVAAGGAPEKFETYIPALDEWYSVSACCCGQGLFMAIFDIISERKRAEFSDQAAMKMLKICNGAKAIQKLKSDLCIFFQETAGCDHAELILSPEVGYNWAEATKEAHISYDDNGRSATATIPMVHQQQKLGILRLFYTDKQKLPVRQLHDINNLLSYSAIALAKLNADSNLLESNRFYRQIIDSLGEGIVVYDCNLHYLLWNRFMEDVSGISSEEITGQKPQQIFSYFQGTGVQERIRYTLDGSPPPAIELPYNFELSGRSGWFMDKFVPLKDNCGNINSAINILHDISDEKTVETALEKVRSFSENALNNLRDTFLVVDLDGRIVKWNRSFTIATGYDDMEIAGRSHTDFTAPEFKPLQRDMLQKIIRHGSASMEGVLVSKEGHRAPYEYTGSRLCDSDGEIIGISMTGRDVSERKALEKQLFHSQKMEAIGTLAGGIAHDFNNLLTVISGYGHLLRMKLTDTQQLHEMEQILTASDKAAFLVNRLLAFSRKLEINLSNVNLAEAVRNIEKFLVRIIGEDIQMRVNIADEELFVKADVNLLEQVLMNLASNARDAMPNGGVLSIELSLVVMEDAQVRQLGYGKPGQYALIAIRDTGQGIDSEIQQHIFEPYFTTKELGKGTGLGLSIVYGIIKQHGGYINFDSSTENGTIFRVYLPLQRHGDIMERKADLFQYTGEETILLLEDEDDVRQIIGMILTSTGFKVFEAGSGQEAIELLKAHKDKIDLLLIDVVMPTMNGMETYREISRINPQAKVVFMSGYPADIIMNRSTLPLGTDFISKPIQSHELAAKIRKLLSRDEQMNH